MTKVEKVARALALEYYRGEYRERYSDPKYLKHIAGPVADDPFTAKQWIEEQAQDMSNRFWTCWENETKELLK